jgi:hypothetical protein
MLEMNWKTTDHGFRLGKFSDQNGKQCSVQESSLAINECVWLGCDDDPLIDSVTGQFVGNRMHLTRDMAFYLSSVLLMFAATGYLPDVRNAKEGS